MKLIELLDKVFSDTKEEAIMGDALVELLPEISSTEEFKDVKSIFTVNNPVFLADEYGTPLEISTEYVGGKVLSCVCSSYYTIESSDYPTGMCIDRAVPEFAGKKIVIYAIEKCGKHYFVDLNMLEPGVWLFPSVTWELTGDPFGRFEKIMVIKIATLSANEGQAFQGLFSREQLNKNILRKVESLLDSREPNVPSENVYKIKLVAL
jgi:hypothetical protein